MSAETPVTCCQLCLRQTKIRQVPGKRKGVKRCENCIRGMLEAKRKMQHVKL